jgi:DNA repair protein RecN (Recombination protein N)
MSETKHRSTDGDQLLELAAENLGVIERLALVFGPGMTAITGETGAGKTLLLTALQLLVGGRADPGVVGPHGDEAVVEGRFVHDGEEVVIQRVIPASGRSRAYLNGRLATVATLAELGAQLVEVNGQHSHTALVATSAQRAALDRYCGVDLAPLVEARMARRDLAQQLAALGGDERERLREQELYRFQVDEIDQVGIADAEEDDRLRTEEELLAGAGDHRHAANSAAELLGTDGPASDAVARVLAAIDPDGPLAELAARVHGLAAELADVAADARALADRIEDDPARLAAVQERRRALSDLRRKYGDSLEEVLAYRDETAERLERLERHDRLAAELEEKIVAAGAAIAVAEAAVGTARRSGAPSLAEEVTAHLRHLALPRAVVECQVGSDPGDDVEFLVSMNAGSPPAPLSKVASGGELARTMLALRLVLSAEPATMVFDEVDAGVGGAAAQAVGAALGRLGAHRQVLVVTHLAQVAACADNHITVVKHDDDTMVSVTASALDRDLRVVELSRMLSGSPDSESARRHAAELLDGAAHLGAVHRTGPATR